MVPRFSDQPHRLLAQLSRVPPTASLHDSIPILSQVLESPDAPERFTQRLGAPLVSWLSTRNGWLVWPESSAILRILTG